MNYTQFLITLIEIIMKDNEGMTVSEIALTEDDCLQHFTDGTTPEDLYFNVWQKDAGHYWRF